MTSMLWWRWAGLARSLGEQLSRAPAARGVALLCGVVYLMQLICRRVPCVAGYSFEELLLYCFGLCPSLFTAGFVWQLVTYLFLHLNIWHLLCNALGLLLLGAGVEMEIGARRFLRLFFIGGVAGGLAWVLLDLAVAAWAAAAELLPPALAQGAHLAAARRAAGPGAICIGASGGLFALIGACAALFPRRRLLLFLVWPVRVSRFAVVLGVLTIGFLIYGFGHVAHLTHLAGGVAGYLYGRRLAAEGWGDGVAGETKRID
jgi:membrane associated rhomboid family serine protease